MSAGMTSITPADRFCDLVMRVGIPSAVVYPSAIAKLAEQCYCKDIGGTSAGAIAAALTAAAELPRRHTQSMAGLDLVGRLPMMLSGKDVAQNSQLRRRVQPDPAGRKLFVILMGSLNITGTLQRAAAIVGGGLVQYWLAPIFSLVLGISVMVYEKSPLGGLFRSGRPLGSISNLRLQGIGNGHFCRRNTWRELPIAGFGLMKAHDRHRRWADFS